MGAPSLTLSPPHKYSPSNLTPRATIPYRLSAFAPKLSISAAPKSPGIYTSSNLSANGSFSPSMSFSFGISPRTIMPRRPHAHKRPYWCRRSVLWSGILLLAGGLNIVYQHFTKDTFTQVGYLLNLSVPNQGAPDDMAIAPIKTSVAPTDFAFPMPASPQVTVVFFHIFIPPNDEGRKNSERIVQEQLQQLASAKNHTYLLYYNTVGLLTDEFNASHINQWCENRNIPCVHLQHYSEGMEDKTLQRLHDFCSLPPDRFAASERSRENNHNADVEHDYSVVYLHNKGSFSTKSLNEEWRYQMTQSVVSDECQKYTTNKPGECNLCGLYFSAERGLFMAGNMWRTRCSYVKKLLPPATFQAAMHAVTADAMFERLRYRLMMTLQEMRAGVFGIDRYSTEFWVGSHPTVRPCDFSNVILPPRKYDMTEVFLRWLRKKIKANNLKTRLQSSWFVPSAPKHPLPLIIGMPVTNQTDLRLREYFLLAGNLFRWYKLYGQAPPLTPESWVYRWFPDGERWKAAVKEHGKNSVEVVTQEALQMEIDSGRNRYTRDNSGRTTEIKRESAEAEAKMLDQRKR